MTLLNFLAVDIRQSLHHLGEITGSITTEDLLDNIFLSFVLGSDEIYFRLIFNYLQIIIKV